MYISVSVCLSIVSRYMSATQRSIRHAHRGRTLEILHHVERSHRQQTNQRWSWLYGQIDWIVGQAGSWIPQLVRWDETEIISRLCFGGKFEGIAILKAYTWCNTWMYAFSLVCLENWSIFHGFYTKTVSYVRPHIPHMLYMLYNKVWHPVYMLDSKFTKECQWRNV